MRLHEIGKALGAEVLCDVHLSRDIMTVCGSDLMSDVLAFARPRSLLLTGLTNPQVVRTAEMAELDAVCFVRGKDPDPGTLRLAKEKGMPLLQTRLTMFESCGRLYARGLTAGALAGAHPGRRRSGKPGTAVAPNPGHQTGLGAAHEGRG